MTVMGKDPVMTCRLPLLALMAALASGATTASTPRTAPTVSWEMVQQQLAAGNAEDTQIRTALSTWRTLASSDASSFASYADFLLAYPGWPEEARLRGNAERLADPDRDDPGKIIRFFTRFPPSSAQGKAVHALALARLGQLAEAKTLARAAWVAGPMDIKYEEPPPSLLPAPRGASDRWWHSAARRGPRRPGAAGGVRRGCPAPQRVGAPARIALRRRAPEAPARRGPADPVGVMDAGYLADKARWMADNGNGFAVREMLASRAPLSQTPTDPEKWYELLLAQARAAAKDSQWTTAYAIASKVDDAFAPGTDVSLQPIGVRDDYTSLAWLAGTAALNQLGRPADAEGMFVRYATGARSPQTVSKGYYWAGRAAIKAGRGGAATDYFQRASAHPDQYYGQLANEHLDYMDYLIDNRPWLAGAQMSLADLAAAAQISVADYLGGLDWSGHEQTRGWDSVFKSRPSFRPLLSERMDVIQPPRHYADVNA